MYITFWFAPTPPMNGVGFLAIWIWQNCMTEYGRIRPSFISLMMNLKSCSKRYISFFGQAEYYFLASLKEKGMRQEMLQIQAIPDISNTTTRIKWNPCCTEQA